jgi:hypothetical protein
MSLARKRLFEWKNVVAVNTRPSSKEHTCNYQHAYHSAYGISSRWPRGPRHLGRGFASLRSNEPHAVFSSVPTKDIMASSVGIDARPLISKIHFQLGQDAELRPSPSAYMNVDSFSLFKCGV